VVLRRLRRRLAAGTGAVAGAGAASIRSTGAVLRLKIAAPISPSAHIEPSLVCTSTRQTAIPVRAPWTGGRFWVRVQRAKMVSPARTGLGNFQLTHSQEATCGMGMSMVPSPTAIATSMAGGARRAWPPDVSTVRGEKSPARAANSATSDSEMVRRRVVHSPPSGRSSKEIGSSSPSIARRV
jgi:hypothetical protein